MQINSTSFFDEKDHDIWYICQQKCIRKKKAIAFDHVFSDFLHLIYEQKNMI